MTDTLTPPDADAADATSTKTAKKAAKARAKAQARQRREAAARRARRRLVAASAVAAVALVAAVVFAVLWAVDDSSDELAELRADAATAKHAEQVAADYALAVSQVDHADTAGWKKALQTGVTEQLAVKMNAAVDVVAPLLERMQYTSTATTLASTVAAVEGDTYVVKVFVDMTSTSMQTPDGVTATASYTITLDRGADWTITDVGGIGAGLPTAEPAPAPAGN